MTCGETQNRQALLLIVALKVLQSLHSGNIILEKAGQQSNPRSIRLKKLYHYFAGKNLSLTQGHFLRTATLIIFYFFKLHF